MAGAGKKTFTAGEILTASDTNTYLMEQTVMYFAGTAARASAIPTPSTGMTTYIGVLVLHLFHRLKLTQVQRGRHLMV